MNGQRVVVLGLARQGTAMARFLAEEGAEVIVSDLRDESRLRPAMEALADLPIRYVLGGHPLSLLDGCELLALSGGVPLTIPIVREARRRGIPLISDAQLFLERCPALVIGITGSAGKTTTTALTGRMLEAAGFRTWVGGNIGHPLLGDLRAIAAAGDQARVVMELSSFQLELVDVSPPVAAVLNITPNHLDRHGTMANYIAAKRNIVAHQRAGDVAVLGYDEPNARGLAEVTPARVRFFSGEAAVATGTFLRDDRLILKREDGERVEVVRRDEIRLRGFHNVLNVLAAIALADAAGVPVEAMRAAIADFTGVRHRLEEVRRWRGMLWVDDSIATAPERALAAIAAFEEPLVLLAGGRDKKLPWELYARRVVRRVRLVITFGEAAPMIEEHLRRALEEVNGSIVLEKIIAAGTLERAVELAAREGRPGEVILLSPGGTSFDAFRDFAERGDRFRALVEALE